MILKELSPGIIKLVPDGSILAKVLQGVTAHTNAGRMSASVVISTEDEDRSGDIVRVKGIDLSEHRKVPAALLNHDKDMPVGRFEDPLGNYTVKVRNDRELVGEIYFHRGSQFAEDVFRAVEKKIFSGVSIGFIPGKVEKRHERGRIFHTGRMVEGSLLTLGDNPHAIVEAVHKGIGSRPLGPELLRILSPLCPERAPVVAGGWEPPMSDTVEKAAPPPKRQPDPYQQGQPTADPMAPVDDPAGQAPDGMDPGAAQDPHADAHAAHKDVVDSAVADMMGSIYNQFCDGVIDKARALAMFSHLLDTHGTVTGAGDMGDDLGEDPDVADLGDEDGDGVPDDMDPDADGDGVPDDEEDGADEEKPKKKAFAAFAKHYQPKMTVVWEFLRRVEGHPKLSIPKVKAKAGEMATLMETLPPIEKALADGELVLKAAPSDPVLDGIDPAALVALWEETTELGARLARVVG